MKKTTMQLMEELGLHEGGVENWIPNNAWEALADLIRADEREACAKVCEQFQKDYVYTADLAGAVAAIKHRMADAIRARGDNV
jgi:hypothetical protein